MMPSLHTCCLSEARDNVYKGGSELENVVWMLFYQQKLSYNFIDCCFCTSFNNHSMWSWSNIVANSCFREQRTDRRD
ncbi:hypothetical protein EUGRSUZ_G00939 [Eucalyptus grandis]|uniref:Uncharacterized protein n=2 Tax=Eucalyptus grandis TaxID=71139 RepID=A0ACC3K2H2_EUCGR|nr:hypothetical protein EUGRSUZ_G00939 [Eucalyptus grandis]